MLEGKALVIAIMMLTAAPIAATDSGQIFIGDVRDNFEDMLANDEPTKVSEIIDDSDRSAEEDTDVPCFTFEEWKERYSDEEKVDEVKAVESKENKNDRARGDDDRKDDNKKEDYYDKEDWADKETVSKYDDCLTDDEWTLKFESDEDKEEPCFTIEDFEKKMGDERKSHKNFFGRDKEWDREEKDWDEEWFEELEILAEACKEGDEESCDELLVIREELAEEREDEERNDEEREDEEDREEACLTMEEWKEVFEKDNDRNKKDFDMSEIIMSLSSMDEEEVSEIKEKLEMSDEEWDAMMVKLESRNMTEEDWDMIMEKMEVLWEDEREDDRKEKGPHRDAIVREMLADFEAACEEGNEEACEDLEVMLSELEEREGGCDKEREEDESNEEEDREDESEEDESEEDDSNEDESEE